LPNSISTQIAVSNAIGQAIITKNRLLGYNPVQIAHWNPTVVIKIIARQTINAQNALTLTIIFFILFQLFSLNKKDSRSSCLGNQADYAQFFERLPYIGHNRSLAKIANSPWLPRRLNTTKLADKIQSCRRYNIILMKFDKSPI